jgi:uncharacterized protein (DUF169 family)
MTNADKVQRSLGLRMRPVAVAFLEAAPSGVSQWSGGPTPAGCAFWKEAGAGNSFYTVQSDHYNCAVGCHTHHIPLPPERAAELQGAVELMVQSGYVQMSEIAGIPTLDAGPKVVAYGPADGAPFKADVVIVAGKPGQMMLLNEACIRAGATSGIAQTLGRPGCAALPMTLKSGAASLSFGCAGNRMFTATPDDEMFLAIPAAKWTEVAAALDGILAANRAMNQHYEQRRASLRVL